MVLILIAVGLPVFRCFCLLDEMTGEKVASDIEKCCMMLLFKTNVVTDFLQIGIGEFLVKCKRFQTMKVAFLLPVFYKGLCLVEVDVRMVAQPLYATTVQS